MTRESELFALARSAFQGALPSEDESRATARRLARRLRERNRRRKFASLSSAALALAGALAYAAEASRSSESGVEPTRAAPVEPAPRHVPRVTVSPAPVAPQLRVAPSSAPVAPSSAAAPLTSVNPPPRATPSTRKSATWAGVARSLARGDEHAARLELERLRVNGSARDSANAAVELARLAVHRGDCLRARNHLEQARASLGSSPSLSRAAEAVARCEASSAPPARVPVKD